MLWVIAILVAAILVTLLGAWRIISLTLATIISLILWLLLAGAASHAFGNWALWTVLALPLVAIFGAGLYLTAKGEIDIWGSPVQKPPDRIDPGVEDFVKRHSWRDRGNNND